MLSDILGLTEEQFVGFFLAFVRISALMAVAPFFGNQTIPIKVKVFLSLFLSSLILPSLKSQIGVETLDLITFIPMVIREGLLGLFLGFNAKFFFETFQFAGRLISTQMGLGMAQLVDPDSGSPATPIGNFYSLIAIVLFLILNGHHLIISAVYGSFELAPVASLSLIAPGAGIKMMTLFNELFIIGIKLAAPSMAALFLMEVSTGIMARIVPQMNIFFVALPLRLGAGLFIVIAFLPAFYLVFISMMSIWQKDIGELIRYF
ncbi:flagellar biosynthetic protein FliR [bacterium]|nr:flagellar biosynthetic protein FliR [bacterium]